MSDGVDDLLEWCERAELEVRDEDGELHLRLDAEDADEVRLDRPDDDGGPLRFHDTVRLAPSDLPEDRLADVVEDIVLSRSSLVDARVTPDGEAAEVVLVIHVEGLNRHTFLEAVFELQKVRLLLHREVAAAVAAEQTLAALAGLAEQAKATIPA